MGGARAAPALGVGVASAAKRTVQAAGQGDDAAAPAMASGESHGGEHRYGGIGPRPAPRRGKAAPAEARPRGKIFPACYVRRKRPPPAKGAPAADALLLLCAHGRTLQKVQQVAEKLCLQASLRPACSVGRLLKKDLRCEGRDKSTSGGVLRQYVGARRLSATKHPPALRAGVSLFPQPARPLGSTARCVNAATLRPACGMRNATLTGVPPGMKDISSARGVARAQEG